MKSAVFDTSQARDLDLDIESGHTAYCDALLIDSMHTPNFIEIGQTFCGRTYGRTDVPIDGRTFPPLMLLG